MMIDKKLIGTVNESKKYIVGNVLLQWISLIANIAMMAAIANLLAQVFAGNADRTVVLLTGAITGIAVIVRFICAVFASRMSHLSSRAVKKTLRELIYRKLLKIGSSYSEKIKTSEVVQLAVEGVDQLETYFGAYLPQFFYAMLAPVTLFVVLCFVNVLAAVVLLICVPLIPVAIAGVQTWAKKLLSKYWGQYTALGDTFLENLQGLTTLKIYQSDGFKNEEMNRESEKFRKITMKVLTMQLNSITIMDLIAYGGAALGIIIAVLQFQAEKVTLAGALLIILLSADFFLPMRMLGSFFHIAMNGMAASGKIFRLLDLPEASKEGKEFPAELFEISDATEDFQRKAPGFRNGKTVSGRDGKIRIENLRFSYEADREILHGVNMEFPVGSFTAIVGESGCGKSTIASILMMKNREYQGSIRVGDTELSQISEQSLMKNITYISHNSYLFKGTVRENLLLGKASSFDEEQWAVSGKSNVSDEEQWAVSGKSNVSDEEQWAVSGKSNVSDEEQWAVSGKSNVSDEELWAVLEKTNLADFLRAEQGLDTRLAEKASNLSGGQCQRLALARALLHDSPIYIFDEATSNIDVESENDIMREILELAKRKTVILISHRLANVTASDRIYVLESGSIAESGTHESLLKKRGAYAKLWNTQQELENYAR